MKRTMLILAGLGAAAAVGVATLGLGLGGRAEASTFHVNFETGQDGRDGLSPQAAWKHAPGDPNAAGIPARTRLQPGDTIVFAADVRYRGEIIVKDSGAPGRPITFAGERPGEAIIDGSDIIHAAPCRNAEECGGAAAWNTLVRIELPAPADESLAIFTDSEVLRPAQEPDPSDSFYRNEVDDMFDADGPAMSQGRVTLPPEMARNLRSGGGSLALWVKPNRVTQRPIQGWDGDTALFDPAKLKFYTNRTAKAAAVDHVSLIDMPGEFATLADRRVIVARLPQGATRVSVGSGRSGFQVRKASHLVFRDLTFEHMSDAGRLAPGGVAIFTADGGSTDIAIENNRFRNSVMVRGQGPIIQRDVQGLKIAGNTFDTIMLGSGMRLTGSDILIEDNDIRRLGRTGIMLIGTSNVTVRRNRITDIRGVHGNGMSVYLDNRDIRIIENTVTDAKQPATFHGDRGKGTADNNILFANNLFVATPDALGALIGWGASTRGVTIRNNVLLGGKTGLRLHAGDTGMTIIDNVASGLIIAKGPPDGWRMAGNEWTAVTFQQRRAGDTKVSQSESKIMASLQRGAAPEDVCKVVKRESLPAPAPPEGVAGAIGAELRCP